MSSNEVKVTAFSFTPAGDTHDRLIKKDTENGKRRFLERFGEPTRIRVDFGAGNPRAVTIIASHHPSDPDHLEMETDYFKGASLYGSDEGAGWTLVAPAQHREYPGQDS